MCLLSGCSVSSPNGSTSSSGGNSGGGSSNTGGSSSSTPTPPTSLPGQIFASPTAIANAHIYVFAASTGGWGGSSISLLDPRAAGVSTDALGSYVTTDGQGGFELAAYSCTPGQQVYLLAHGGTPAGQTYNYALSLLSILGTCPSEGNFNSQIGFVNMTQISTVVSVYALAGFMTDATHVSAGPSANAQAGLANAFHAFANVMEIGTGTVYTATQSGPGLLPMAEIDTLANILVPCSNAPAACALLFTQTTPPGGPAPVDMVGAMLSIARRPASHVAELFALAGGQPFQPALTAAPNDWTVGITYTVENLAGPYFPAVDAYGNLWVPGYANNTITVFDPLGTVLTGTAGLTGGGLAQPVSAAFDSAGNAWLANFGAVSPGSPVVSEFGANGAAITSNGFACGAACTQIAIDTGGNVWVSGKPQVSVLRNSGHPLSTFSLNGISSGLAIDSRGNGWAIGSGANLSRLTLPGTVTQFSEGVTSTSGELNGIAIDGGDNIWVTSPRNNRIGEFSNTGAGLSPVAGYTGGGLNGPVGIAIDGSGRAWVTNRDGSSVSAFAPDGTPITPATGYHAAGISNPRGIVVDPSGNVWTSNFTGNSVTELLGAATPTASPMTPTNHGQLP